MKKNKKHINIALFECTPFSSNKGVAALAYSAIFLLDELLSKYGVEYTIYIVHDNIRKYKNIIDYNGYKIKYYGIQPIQYNNVKNILKLLIFSFFPINKYRYYKYLTFDYAMNVGSGDSFADIYGEPRFDRVNSHFKICKFFHIPQMMLPQTIGPFKNASIRKKAICTMDSCLYVLPRDKQSYKYLEDCLIPKEKYEEMIDMAFFMPYIPIRHLEKNIINVGINVSGLLWHGGYTKDNQFRLTVDYPILIRQLIEMFSGMDNVCVHLISHVHSEINNIENDYDVCHKLHHEYKDNRILLAPAFNDPISAKNYISSLDFFIGARMHSTIAAFSSNVPVVPMSYSRKFEGLFNDTLKYNNVANMTHDSNDKIVSQIKNAFENRVNLKKIIQEINNNITQSRRNILVNYISKFLNIN